MGIGKEKLEAEYLPGLEIPNTHVTVTAATHQGITPRDHSPNAHDMALESALRIALAVKYVDLGVIKSQDDVLWGKMEACDDATFLGDVPRNTRAPRSPGSLYQVALFKMRLV